LDRGLLKDWERTGPKGQRWLELEGLQARVQEFVRLTSNSHRGKTEPLEQEVDLRELTGGGSDASRFWQQVQALTQIRHSSPLWRRGGAEEISEAALEPINRWIEARDKAPAWDAVAKRLNAYLGDGWPAPPWDGDQVATLALCLEMAQGNG